MEHAHLTSTVLAAAVVLAATTAGLAGCATAAPADSVRVVVDHRELVRESADRYVQEQLDRARASGGHRELVRESADRYVDELLERARGSADGQAAAADDNLSPLAVR